MKNPKFSENRKSLRIEIDTSLPPQRVIWAVDALVELHVAPRRLRLDDGRESISVALRIFTGFA